MAERRSSLLGRIVTESRKLDRKPCVTASKPSSRSSFACVFSLSRATGARLNQYAPGGVVRPTGASEERLAIVVAEEPCQTMVLSSATRHHLEANRPDLALKLYRYVLAERFRTGSRRNTGFGEGGKSMILDDKLAAGDVIVLDGAIGSEIDRIGGKMDQAAWCGLANLTDPDTVRRVHESYLEAGADVITATALHMHQLIDNNEFYRLCPFQLLVSLRVV